MLIKEINVLVDNKPGQLYKTLETLGNAKIDLCALSCDRSENNKTNVSMIANDPEKAEKILTEAGFNVSSEEVVIVDISNSPGELARVCKILHKNGINVETVYASTSHIKKRALSIFKFDNNEKAIEILKNNHITIVTDETIKDTYQEKNYEEERSIKEYFSTIVSP